MADEKKSLIKKHIFRLFRTGVNKSHPDSALLHAPKNSTLSQMSGNTNVDSKKSQKIGDFRMPNLEAKKPGGAFSLAQFEGDEDAVSFERSQNSLPGNSPNHTGNKNAGEGTQGRENGTGSGSRSGTGAKINQPAGKAEPGDSIIRLSTGTDLRNNTHSRTGSALKSASSQPNFPPQSQLPQNGQSVWPDASRQNSRKEQSRGNQPQTGFAGFSDGTAANLNTSFRLAQSDPYIARRRLFIIFLIALLLGGGCYALYKHPEIMKLVQARYNGIFNKSESAADQTDRPEQAGLLDAATIEKAEKILPSELEKAISSGGCQSIVHAGLREVSNTKLAMGARVRIVDCFLSAGNYADAEMMLRPLRSQLQKSSDRVINQEDAESGIKEAFIIATVAYLKAGRFADAVKLNSNHCSSWALTATCVAKLLVEIKIGNIATAAAGYSKIIPDIGHTDLMTKAYLSYVGGQINSARNALQLADEHYDMALRTAAKSNSTLICSIYDSWGIALYKRKDFAGFAKIIGKALQEGANIDSLVTWKLLLLREFTDSQRGPVALKQFFSRPDYTSRVRQNFEFMEAIGRDALAWNQTKRYAELVGGTRLEMQAKLRADTSVMSVLNIWQLRALLAENRHGEIFAALTEHERIFGSSYIISHFRGIAYMDSSQDPKSQILAAREFRAAADSRESWESLYGLTVALIRGGEAGLARPILMKLEAAQSSLNSKRWYSLARAELMIATNRAREALTRIEEIQLSDSRSIVSWKLKEAALRQLGQRAEAAIAGQTVDVLQRELRYLETKEGRSAPLGPLVFAE